MISNLPWQLVSDGAITAEAVDVFTRGACAGLAVALHDATGWPLVEVGHCDGLPIHFMVRDLSGRLIDIEGAHTDEDVADEYEFVADGGAVTFTEMSRDAVLASYREDSGEPVPMSVVHAIAPVVLGAL
ncbi:hypothetical protein [Streptomyces sp. NBC_00842]|uniref:hypothetical protein n=1 Tax=Streptomyces sp. NBC_00842 TaxID=2975848 RepID=UPI002F913EDD|nr:hypothetical protein OH821_45425 [Streptomyces sp. NBC_00842]